MGTVTATIPDREILPPTVRSCQKKKHGPIPLAGCPEAVRDLGLIFGMLIISGRTRNVQGTATVSQITMPEKLHSVPWQCPNGQLR